MTSGFSSAGRRCGGQLAGVEVLQLFARIDHATGARKAGVELEPNVLLIWRSWYQRRYRLVQTPPHKRPAAE